jgi:hypothetical protein
LYAGVPPVDDRPVTTPLGRQTARRNRTPYVQRCSPLRARNRRDRWDQSFDDSPVHQYPDPPPVLNELSAEYRETDHLGVLERVVVASNIGSLGLAHTASPGEALLAMSSDEVVGRTKLPIPIDFAARGVDMAAELQPRRRARCARCARSGRRSARADGTPLFANSLTGPSAQFALEWVTAPGPRLVEIARQLPIRLDWEPENGTMCR